MKKFIAEFVGTAVLVIVGCGTAAATGCNGASIDAAYILTALAFGLSIVAMAYSIGNVSGCHINPAVSFGVYLNKGMSRNELFLYWGAQILGGICGAAIVGVLCGFDSSMGANGLYQDNILSSIIVETVLTFIFVLAILGVTSKPENGKVAGVVIGLTLTLVHILGIHFTGTSVNPARSLGPALFKGGAALTNVWVFFVGPLLGAFLAAMVWKVLKEEKA